MSKSTQMRHRFRFEVMYRPGHNLGDKELSELVSHLHSVGQSCFDELPTYQVFKGTRDAFQDKVLALAWNGEKLAGFCSELILKVDGIGEVLHLGLTCIRPEYRSSGLTHRLTSKATMCYLLRSGRLLGKIWVTNCAAVLGSLVNVYLHFDSVYPSPANDAHPSENHLKIAEAIDRFYREDLYIHSNAVFDQKSFLFRGSIKDTAFEKAEDDRRFHHRNTDHNNYYRNLISFENGDEVLQVGYAGLFTYFNHFISCCMSRANKLISKHIPKRQSANMSGNPAWQQII